MMRLSIFDDLIGAGYLTEEQLLECQNEERVTGAPLDRILRQKGHVTEHVLSRREVEEGAQSVIGKALPDLRRYAVRR